MQTRSSCTRTSTRPRAGTTTSPCCTSRPRRAEPPSPSSMCVRTIHLRRRPRACLLRVRFVARFSFADAFVGESRAMSLAYVQLQDLPTVNQLCAHWHHLLRTCTHDECPTVAATLRFLPRGIPCLWRAGVCWRRMGSSSRASCARSPYPSSTTTPALRYEGVIARDAVTRTCVKPARANYVECCCRVRT